ncbi:hypothetical protein COOONC_00329 [Cooperia oncophora]
MQLSEMEIEGSVQQGVAQPQHVITQATVDTFNVVQHPTQKTLNNTQSCDQQTPIAYSQDIDDLMAVLRDDQDGCLKPGSFQMDLGVGYGSEELADLLGEDWLDCADRSIANNGQYAPYASEPNDVSSHPFVCRNP